MASNPSELSYTKEHEWVKVTGGEALIGITTYAQDQLGDVVFVELPTVGQQVKQGATFGTVESVKAVSDLYAPLSGEIIEVNNTLIDTPELINSDPFGQGWMIKVKVSALEEETKTLLSADQYEGLLKAH